MRVWAGLLLLVLGSCVELPGPVEADSQVEFASAMPVPARVGQDIVINGTRVDIGAPVVLWNEAGGYNGYATDTRAGTNPSSASAETGKRYKEGRLAEIDQFVVHYDVCGTSRTCFEVLHHLRGLSVHFLLDIDGTLYQTIDVGETAWHATRSNARSIGVEMAHIGARLPSKVQELDEWYGFDAQGLRITLPARHGDGGVRTPNFVGRPARPGLIEGRINGSRLLQYDFTDEQYETLSRLLAVLTRELPELPMRFPLDGRGEVRDGVLSGSEWKQFSGVLAHYHVQLNKTDPGPAFDWARLQR